jgi:hypothetical protein
VAAAVAAAMAFATAGVSAALESAAVFVDGTMTGIAYVALAIAGFVALEVAEGAVAAIRHGAGVAMMGIVAVVDVSVEAAGTVEPRTCANEQAAVEPVGTVVAVGRAVVGSVVVVAIGALGRYADADGDLAGRSGGRQGEPEGGDAEGENFAVQHVSSLLEYAYVRMRPARNSRGESMLMVGAWAGEC